MNAMFASSVFHHDLCAWSEKMDNIVSQDAVHRMFSYSCCDVMQSPTIGTWHPKTPLCQRCGDVFTTTADLYNAVDNYLNDLSIYGEPQTGGLYKFPIGFWKVGLLTDFSRVFSATRIPSASIFNENIQDWDMSNAEDLLWMFQGKFGQSVMIDLSNDRGFSLLTLVILCRRLQFQPAA